MKNKLLVGFSLVFFVLSLSALGVGIYSVLELKKDYLSITLFILHFLLLISSVFLYQKFSVFQKVTKIRSVENNRNALLTTFNSWTQSGIIYYDKNGNIYNVSSWLLQEGFSKLIKKNISKLGFELFSSNYLENSKNFVVNGKHFSLFIKPEQKIIFAKSINLEYVLKKEISERRMVIILVKVNYSSVLKTDKIKKSSIEIKLEKEINNWTKKHSGVYIPLGELANEDYLLVLNWHKVENFFSEENNLLLKMFDEALGENRDSVLISIGVSTSYKDLNEIYEDSNEALTICENRGSNQITLFNLDNRIYIGKSSNSLLNVQRPELNFFYTNLIETMRKSYNIIITTHKMADIDGISSIFGLMEIASFLNKNVSFYIKDMDDSTKYIYEQLGRKYINNKIDRIEKLNNMITNRTMLISVDILIKNRLQIEDISNFDKDMIFGIDHHRVSAGSVISIPKNIYLNPFSSSTSEIVTEIIFKFFNGTIKHISQTSIPTLLYAGINLDTNQLSKNSSSITFNMISYLVSAGASLDYINKLFKIPKTNRENLQILFENSEFLQRNIVLCVFPDDKILSNQNVAIFANKLLDFENVEVSIVISKISDSEYKLSARSTNKQNVQILCEKLGGGGHFNAAATSFDIDKFDIYKNKLKNLIKELY